MTALAEAEHLDLLGDQPRLSEPAHARRARFHQSWYRATRLGISGWGSTRFGRPLGSILPPDAAAAGANFISAAARDLFLRRRQLGWGVDPVRMTSHMTSSQALLVNLIGPLSNRPDWLIRVLAGLLERDDFHDLLCCEIEFAPRTRSRYLGDMTRVDGYFVVATDSGPEGIVLELKYTDRFSVRRLQIASNARYEELAMSSGAWKDSRLAFADGAISQLLRCHALGMRSLQVDFGALPTTLLLVSHPLDPAPVEIAAQYQQHLSHPEALVHQTLDSLLDLAALNATTENERGVVAELALRYLRHDLSEPLWEENDTRVRKP